jgi:hypothetical protein
MLSDRNKQKILSILLASSLVAIGGCSNSAAIESSLSPDPQLQSSIGKTGFEETSNTPTESIPNADRNAPTANSLTNQNPNPENQLIARLPQQIPIYPQAILENIEPDSTAERGKANWNSSDGLRPIARYYQNELKIGGWKIIQPFDLQTQELNQVAIANKDNLEITIALEGSTGEGQNPDRQTKLTIAYQPLSVTANEPVTSSSNNKSGNGNAAVGVASNNNKANNTDDFVDLNEVPEQLQGYVKDMAALGILSPYTNEGNAELSKFAPNKPVTRAEYASWLIAANNIYHANSPGDKIYLANKSDRVAFQDVNSSNANFGAIQGLAEAGLVPSMLSDDSSKLLFQPNAPLTRVDLITWKVPLDVRKSLPNASLDAIAQSWGFQDVTKVDPVALKALFADFQNGDRSNIRRIFGYTTLFQPQKAVTRAEAAASLWYFGNQGDGITAKEASAIK